MQTQERVQSSEQNGASGTMGEHEFWLIVRASLLNIVSAIEKRYDMGARRKEERVPQKIAR